MSKLRLGLLEYIASAKHALNEQNIPAALTLVLTLPDICSQVEYGSGGNKEKYIKWCKSHINEEHYPDTYGWAYASIDEDGQKIRKVETTRYPHFSAEAPYKLRCKILHCGSADIETDLKLDLDDFDLSITDDNSMGYAESAGIWSIGNDGVRGDVKRRLRVDVRKLCEVIIEEAESFYVDCQDKSGFDKHAVTLTDFRENV